MDIPSELIAGKNAAKPDLIALPRVVGVGIGLREVSGEFFDELAVWVLVRDASAVPARIPETIGGGNVDGAK